MKIFFSVGEPSGDIHGANLIRELRARYNETAVEDAPPLVCEGFGGPRMKDAGCEILFDLTSLAVMWVWQALRNIRQFFRLADEAEERFRTRRPDAVVLIDYPGFNWHIAKRAKKYGIPVFYYSPPQVWAWRAGRVKKMRRWVDTVFSGLPFECDWLKEHGCDAVYVGHPYFDEVRRLPEETDLTHTLRAKTAAGQRIVALLPGSRTQEVKLNFPTFLNVVTRVAGQSPDVSFVVAAFNDPQAALVRDMIAAEAKKNPSVAGLLNRDCLRIETGRTAEVIRQARCCLSVSGSVSLELLYYEKPSVIAYRVATYAWWMQWYFRRVKYITLPNLLVAENPFRNYNGEYRPDGPEAAEVLFPEYLSSRDRSAWMADDLLRWLRDDHACAETVRRMQDLKARVAQNGAAGKAAAIILEKLTERPSGTHPENTAF